VPTLYLLRHAKSSWEDADLADHDRPLAPRGLRACARLKSYCTELTIEPELVLCSTATRARETLARVLGDHPAVIFDGDLYLATGRAITERIRGLTADSAMVVGHNPGLHDALLNLSHRSQLREDVAEKFPTGALATLELESWDAPTADLVALVLPREL
jgi:phosphohistidine phosphatase